MLLPAQTAASAAQKASAKLLACHMAYHLYARMREKGKAKWRREEQAWRIILIGCRGVRLNASMRMRRMTMTEMAGGYQAEVTASAGISKKAAAAAA
jgi:hypothetical protein